MTSARDHPREQRFREDKLRMIRAAPFAARFSYAIDKDTLNAVVKLTRTCSAERIRDEITKLLTEGSAHRVFELLDETAAGDSPEILA